MNPIGKNEWPLCKHQGLQKHATNSEIFGEAVLNKDPYIYYFLWEE